MRKINSKELETLAGFCTQDKISGFCSNLWFNSLVRKYPIHFLFLTESIENKFLYHEQIARELIKDSFEKRLYKYLEHPLTAQGVNLLEDIYSSLR